MHFRIKFMLQASLGCAIIQDSDPMEFATFFMTKSIRLKRSWTVLVCFCVIAAVEQVQGQVIQGQLAFSINNGAATLIGSTGPVENLIIPSQINNVPVTAIGDQSFYSSSVTNVTIPDSVTSIGESAFNDCTSLASVTIPDSVTSIGGNSFYASSLTSIEIPDGVSIIGSESFAFCEGLTNVSIGSGVTNIGQGAFEQCHGVKAYAVAPSNTAYCSVDGVLFDKMQTTLIWYPGGATGSYTIPASVTNLGYAGFNLCFNLKSAYFEGDAPVNDPGKFQGSPVTIYYLPGTVGWSTNLDNHATAVWTLPNPQILNGSAGVQSNQFGFTVSWATNLSVVVEACTDLTNPIWQPVQTSTLTATPDGGWFAFSDPQWTNYPARFYRIATQ
jgi:hypothetical protein